MMMILLVLIGRRAIPISQDEPWCRLYHPRKLITIPLQGRLSVPPPSPGLGKCHHHDAIVLVGRSPDVHIRQSGHGSATQLGFGLGSTGHHNRSRGARRTHRLGDSIVLCCYIIYLNKVLLPHSNKVTSYDALGAESFVIV